MPTESCIIFLMTLSSGVPSTLIIWFSWSLLSLPLNSGTPEIISAKLYTSSQPSLDTAEQGPTYMHPALHTSILVLYVLEPSRTSGARYQSVTTCPPPY